MRRHVEKLSTTIDEYRTVFEKLFPNTTPESLVQMPREQLLELMGKRRASQGQQHLASPATSTSVDAHISPVSNDDGNLESLQSMPEGAPDSRSSGSDMVNNVSDDVNALSLSSRQPSSYLGISSIHAILKVIVWLDPGCLSYFSRTSAHSRRASVDYPRPQLEQTSQPITPPHGPQMMDMQIIDAYFTYFQPFVPMIDEHAFRETYASGRRRDSRWLGLLNTILALGTIAASTSDDLSHQTYFERAKRHLGLDSLGCSHLETIQTLGLLGGYYLHYVSQPNLSYALMGAALRMAATLGLHKEFEDCGEVPSMEKISSMDLKRRVWWSLFCMDTWGCMTLGRPTMGRIGPTITVKLPQYREKVCTQPSVRASLTSQDTILDILPLLENVRFCKIATQIQEAMVVAPLVRHPDIISLDNQLLEWYDSLPTILKDHEPCSESLTVARTVIRWRYYNQRLLLYRPTLLSYAMRRVPYIALRSEERSAIEKCREIAEITIHDISSTTRQNQMLGWNGVWLLFQAVMVPILGLFLSDNSGDNRASVESCRNQVEIAMFALARMQPWSPTAKRTLDVVSRLLDASQRGDLPGENNPPANYPVEGVDIIPDLPEGPTICNPVDPFNYPFFDDAAGQNLWDYLSWGDNSLWPGLADFESTGDMAFAQEKSSGMFDLPDSSYLVNSSMDLFIDK